MGQGQQAGASGQRNIGLITCDCSDLAPIADTGNPSVFVCPPLLCPRPAECTFILLDPDFPDTEGTGAHGGAMAGARAAQCRMLG